MASVELSLSETFHKHKRNLVLLCSAVIVLRIASPARLKLPFLGADVDLPAAIAFILLGLALIYMFVQYYIEYMTMLARHCAEVLGAKKSVDEVIDNHLKTMEEWVTQLSVSSQFAVNLADFRVKIEGEELRATFDNYIYNLTTKINDTTDTDANFRKVFDNGDANQSINTAIGKIERHVDRAIDTVKQESIRSIDTLERLFTELLSKQDVMNESLRAYTETYQMVAKSFKRLSSKIGWAQRVGFRLIDGYFVQAFAALSLAACVSGALGWWPKPATPAPASKPSAPLPKLVQRANTTVPTPK